MSNNKDFKVKNGIQPTVYQEGVGTVVSNSQGYYLSGASYDGVSFSVAGEESSPYGLFFKPDGTKMYVTGYAGDDVNEYNLSTAWDITTASYSQNFSVVAQEISPTGIFFKPDGLKMYVVGEVSANVNEYTLVTAWDISTASYSQNFSVGTQDTEPNSLFFKPDGLKMYVVGNAGNDINEYDLSSAWDVSTSTFLQVFSVSAQDAVPSGIFFNLTGTSMYVLGQSGRYINEYTLGTAWGISTASYSQNFSVGTQDTSPTDLFFKPDGTKMYVIGVTNDTVYQYSTVLTTASLDLSSGSVFDYTPTSDVQVTLTNPAASGTSSGATLLLGAEDAVGVSSAFSTTLYTGNSAEQTITNGINLSGDGGMVWGKIRSSADQHWIVDSENGIGSNGTYNYLQPSLATALSNFGDRSVKTFNSDGFTLANSTNDQFNLSPETYVSWTFKKQTKFFDVVTWTGNAVSGREISHNLGTTVGCVMVKNTSNIENWMVYHIGSGIDGQLNLNTDAAATDDSTQFNDTVPSSTVLTLGSNAEVNANGQTYVAYLFAHDTDASSLIKCGSYTGNGSAGGNSVSLGWEPQFIIIKNTSGIADWVMFDTKRGVVTGGSAADDKYLFPNGNNSEGGGIPIDFNATGFTVFDTSARTNSSGSNYVYMAIRSAFVPTITYDPDLQWSGGTAPTAPAIGETDVLTFNTTDGGTTYKSALAIDGAK
jgi:hypothetical protein